MEAVQVSTDTPIVPEIRKMPLPFRLIQQLKGDDYPYMSPRSLLQGCDLVKSGKHFNSNCAHAPVSFLIINYTLTWKHFARFYSK